MCTIGRQALQAQNFTGATDAHNTAVGFSSGFYNTTGTLNTFWVVKLAITTLQHLTTQQLVQMLYCQNTTGTQNLVI